VWRVVQDRAVQDKFTASHAGYAPAIDQYYDALTRTDEIMQAQGDPYTDYLTKPVSFLGDAKSSLGGVRARWV
jgi:hypothetical protein